MEGEGLAGVLRGIRIMRESVVLLPTYNERENLARLAPRLSAVEKVDVLVIDDSSPDGTGSCAEALRGRYPRLSVLHRRKKEGLGRAYVHGMKEALRRGYSRIVTMDADLSHAPEDVPRLLAAVENAEIAIGSRHAPGGGVEMWPLPRRVLSRVGSLYARALLGIGTRDTTSGFRAYRSEVLEGIDLDSIRAYGFAFQVEILRLILDLPDVRVREVPIVFRGRSQGRSKLTLSIIAEAATEVLRLRARRPPLSSPKRSRNRDTEPDSVSVIVPLRPCTPMPIALAALGAGVWPRGGTEVILARGECPSRQRNAAAREASGDLLLFLDDDSVPAKGLLDAYREAYRREPSAAAVGGPAVYLARSFRERLSAAVLSEPLVMGRSAGRYSALGALRASDERELILANLSVRRSAFEAVGGFEEALYPNEENLLLERLRARGEGVFYQPTAVVTRPAPKAGPELFGKVFRYGRGRAAQARRQLSFPSLARVSAAAAAVVFLSAALAALPWGIWPAVLFAALLAPYQLAVAVRAFARGGICLGVAAPIVALGVHLAYAAGVLSGLLWLLPTRGGEVTIEKAVFSDGISPDIQSANRGRRSLNVHEEVHHP